jgi:hypothetical protein
MYVCQSDLEIEIRDGTKMYALQAKGELWRQHGNGKRGCRLVHGCMGLRKGTINP